MGDADATIPGLRRRSPDWLAQLRTFLPVPISSLALARWFRSPPHVITRRRLGCRPPAVVRAQHGYEPRLYSPITARRRPRRVRALSGTWWDRRRQLPRPRADLVHVGRLPRLTANATPRHLRNGPVFFRFRTQRGTEILYLYSLPKDSSVELTTRRLLFSGLGRARSLGPFVADAVDQPRHLANLDAVKVAGPRTDPRRSGRPVDATAHVALADASRHPVVIPFRPAGIGGDERAAQQNAI